MSKWITPDVRSDAPPPRNLTQELNAIYAAQARFAPQTQALDAQYSPLYNRTQIGNLRETLQGFDENGVHQPGQLELARDAASTTREGDIADVSRLGPEATAAYLAANPWLGRSLTAYNDAALTADPLVTELNREATDALASHGQLSPQEQRALDQETQAEFARRGMTAGNFSVASGLLARDAAVRSRMAGAQDFAGRVAGINSARIGQLGDVTRTNATVLNDPYMSVTGRSGGAGATAALSPLNNSHVYSPMDFGAYGADLFNTNYNAGINLAIQNSNAQANTRSSIAQVAGGFFGSDRALKENIHVIGKSSEGYEIVEFDYKPGRGPKGRWRGVIAQQVQRLNPAAVMRGGDGMLRVRYGALDVKLERIPDIRSMRKAA